MASHESQSEIKVNSDLPSYTRRKTHTPWLPGMDAYSFRPVFCRYWKYVSLSASRVTPRQIRAIIFSPQWCGPAKLDDQIPASMRERGSRKSRKASPMKLKDNTASITAIAGKITR